MNNNTTSQFMDKQIMDLSNSQSSDAPNNNSNSGGGNNDFIDFMNRPTEKKDDIVPNYDFMPIRPAVGSSSPPATRSSIFDAAEDGAPLRTWNSFDSKTNASSVRNYNSHDADEPAKFILGKNQRSSNAPSDVSMVSEIDRTMKKYVDDLMHAMDSMSARLSQLETRARSLENSVDDLKVSVENNHGITDGKMRLLENILRELQTGVHAMKDKQEAVEAELQSAKLQVPKVGQRAESQNITHTVPTPTVASAPQQFSAVSVTQPPPTLPPPPQHNLQPQPQLQLQLPPNQFPQNQVPSMPRQESYYPSPNQTPENPSLQYQIPPPQQQPPPLPPQHQYQSPPQPQYSQPPPPSQPHSSFSPVNPSLPSPLGHHPEESSYMPPQTYPPNIRPPTSNPATGAPPPPPQQYYGPTSNVYEPPPNRPGPGYSGSFGPSSGHGEPYPYSSSPSQYGSGSPVKPQQLSSPGMGQSGGSGYPQLPTARILPQALPTASGVGGGSGSGSGGSGNKVPIDDVVDRVTNMGFSRDQVRATVRRLTENGQAVDLNIVLDKLMNDGDGQAPRGWFGR